MTIEELQGWVRSNWEQRSHHQPSIELQLLYILEELGEVAEAIRKIGGLKSRAHNEVDLGSEFADLIISITMSGSQYTEHTSQIIC